MEIFGVDFSGARTDKNTWVCQAALEGATLVLLDCRPVARAQLTDMLAGIPGPAVASLDFPFSVPADFARFWQSHAQTMPDLWEASNRMEYDEFLALRDEFVVQHGEQKRLSDTYYPECYSCLHKANPNMVPMTFRGMQMLDRLWAAGCSVPPLVRPIEPIKKETTVLLEAMPGAALRAFQLPYKGYKNGVRAQELRARIVDGLSDCSTVPIHNLADFRPMCLENHDCLDSVVAAVIAALWVRDQSLFRCPPTEGAADFDPLPSLEGWLYAPTFLQSRTGECVSSG